MVSGEAGAGEQPIEQGGESLFTTLPVSEQLALLYRELRRLASRLMAEERADHTLQTTALVHEAWLKLVGSHGPRSEDRTHFLRLAARAMRQVLIDHARRKAKGERYGEELSLEPGHDPAAPWQGERVELVALDEALSRLDAEDEESARVVELRFFGGLSLAETASVLGLSARQVEGRWNFARSWLRREMERGAGGDG